MCTVPCVDTHEHGLYTRCFACPQCTCTIPALLLALCGLQVQLTLDALRDRDEQMATQRKVLKPLTGLEEQVCVWAIDIHTLAPSILLILCLWFLCLYPW